LKSKNHFMEAMEVEVMDQAMEEVIEVMED
jgi:hypothetical protein